MFSHIISVYFYKPYKSHKMCVFEAIYILSSLKENFTAERIMTLCEVLKN
jgi:hypothetical protein